MLNQPRSDWSVVMFSLHALWLRGPVRRCSAYEYSCLPPASPRRPTGPAPFAATRRRQPGYSRRCRRDPRGTGRYAPRPVPRHPARPRDRKVICGIPYRSGSIGSAGKRGIAELRQKSTILILQAAPFQPAGHQMRIGDSGLVAGKSVGTSGPSRARRSSHGFHAIALNSAGANSVLAVAELADHLDPAVLLWIDVLGRHPQHRFDALARSSTAPR